MPANRLRQLQAFSIAGPLVLWVIVDFYRVVMPDALGVVGFEKVRAARACVLIAATAVLFGYFAIPAGLGA